MAEKFWTEDGDMIKNGPNLIYRLWEQLTGSIELLVSGSPILTLIEYKEKHDS